MPSSPCPPLARVRPGHGEPRHEHGVVALGKLAFHVHAEPLAVFLLPGEAPHEVIANEPVGSEVQDALALGVRPDATLGGLLVEQDGSAVLEAALDRTGFGLRAGQVLEPPSARRTAQGSAARLLSFDGRLAVVHAAQQEGALAPFCCVLPRHQILGHREGGDRVLVHQQTAVLPAGKRGERGHCQGCIGADVERFHRRAQPFDDRHGQQTAQRCARLLPLFIVDSGRSLREVQRGFFDLLRLTQVDALRLAFAADDPREVAISGTQEVQQSRVPRKSCLDVLEPEVQALQPFPQRRACRAGV